MLTPRTLRRGIAITPQPRRLILAFMLARFPQDVKVARAIQPGVDNKDSVEKALGRPSFTGQFTPNDWYYVSRDVNQVAFRNARVRKQTVMIVRFDQKGNVASVQNTGKELVMNLEPTGKKTPTLGRKRSFFEELFGNIGSVGAPGLPGQGGGPNQ